MIPHRCDMYHALRALAFSVPKAVWFALWTRKPSQP